MPATRTTNLGWARPRTAWLGAAVLAVVAAGAGATAWAETGPVPAATVDTRAAAPAGPRWVTLLTGDRVRADPARQRYEFRPAAGRAGMPHRSTAIDGRHLVIPGDAQLLVAAGRLDARLFDVPALLARGTDLPLLVTGTGAPRRERVSASAAGRRWAELTEPAPAAAGARLGSRRLRAGTHAVALDTGPADRARPLAAPPGSAVGGPRAGAGEAVLTIAYRDRRGAPAADAYSALLAIDDPEASTWVAAGPDGTATVRLPRGRFHVESVVSTARPGHDVPSTSVLVNPELAVRRDLRVAVDAAAAAPVTVTVPDPAAVGESVAVSIARTAPWGRTTTSYGGAPGAVFTHHDGPAVAGGAMDTVVSAVFARPGPAGTAVDSPLVYATAWRQRGRLVTGLRQRVTEAELATVRAEHGAQGPGRRASKGLLIAHSPTTKTGHWLDYTRTPFARVERYAGNVEWANELEEYALAGEPGAEAPVDRTTQAQAPTAYEPGRRYAERWNVAPFWADAGLWRSRDRVIADPGLYGDQAGRVGTSAWRRAQVALYRDGALVGEADRLDGTVFDVPPGANRYRLTAAAERDFGGLATAVSAAWTFTSTAGAAEYTKQPLLAVRYAPPVDLRGRAPAGRTVALPVSVQVGPRDAAVRSLAVDVSYDGGRGWRPVRLAGAGARRVGLLHHPAGPGAVSLRARVADAAGDTVEHTLINAYRLAGPAGAPPASSPTPAGGPASSAGR